MQSLLCSPCYANIVMQPLNRAAYLTYILKDDNSLSHISWWFWLKVWLVESSLVVTHLPVSGKLRSHHLGLNFHLTSLLELHLLVFCRPWRFCSRFGCTCFQTSSTWLLELARCPGALGRCSFIWPSGASPWPSFLLWFTMASRTSLASDSLGEDSEGIILKLRVELNFIRVALKCCSKGHHPQAWVELNFY